MLSIPTPRQAKSLPAPGPVQGHDRSDLNRYSQSGGSCVPRPRVRSCDKLDLEGGRRYAAESEINDEFMREVIGRGRRYVLAFYLTAAGGPQMSEEDAGRLQMQHLRFLFGLRADGKIVLNGPLVDEGPLRGIAILDMEDLDLAAALLGEDPAGQGRPARPGGPSVVRAAGRRVAALGTGMYLGPARRPRFSSDFRRNTSRSSVKRGRAWTARACAPTTRNSTSWDFNNAISSFQSLCIVAQDLPADREHHVEALLWRQVAPIIQAPCLHFLDRADLDRPPFAPQHSSVVARGWKRRPSRGRRAKRVSAGWTVPVADPVLAGAFGWMAVGQSHRGGTSGPNEM